MGEHHNDSRSPGGSNKGKRGSVKNSARLEAFAERSARGSAEWSSCDAELLQAVVVAITGMGGAVIFALSRDQGAHSMTLLLDDAKETMWYNGDASLDANLREALALLEAMV